MDIKIVEHDGCVSLYLEVVLEPDGKVYKPVHAIGWLEEKGYKVGKCVKKDVVRNKTEREKLRKGHWTFELLKSPKSSKKPAVKKKATRRPFTQTEPEPIAKKETTEE
tara:strand:+ start:913 stop:1236 length:324 start_codon:yes stop_codon:yes gene_type:complete